MIYRFEDYQLDTDAFELRCGGRTCHVEPQVFDVLACLVENAHRQPAWDAWRQAFWEFMSAGPASGN